MSFPRYPEYKDSGVEWLGEVPAHWSVTALKRGFEVTLGKMLQPESSNPEDKLLPYLRAGNIQWGGVDTSDIKEMWLSKRDRAQLRLDPGDLLVSEGGDVGRSCLWAAELGDCYFQNSVNRIRARDGNSNRYLCYWMSTIKDKGYIDVLCNKSTIAHFTAEKVEAVPVPFPPVPEQDHISNFLDRETTKIDGLVREQRQLMELLKEKRQAVISQTVIKGLNPDAIMKPSCVGWLGDVPEHWDITPLKWLTDPARPIMYGIVLPGPDVGEGIPILKGGNVRPSRMNLQSMARTTSEIEAPYARARLKHGDLVYSIRGSIGDCEPVPAELEGSNITQDVARVAVAEGVCAPWVRWALLSSAIRDDLACGSLGAAVRGINIFDLKRASIPTPPPGEQVEIARFITAETEKLEKLATEAQRGIDLLLERRSALIAAAVTGQIDVRKVAERVLA